MKYTYLVVIIPRKWLPQNTEQARTQAWVMTSQKLLPDLGRLYSRFYPAPHAWGLEILSSLGVVLGNEDPVTFLNVFYRAKKRQDEAAAFHSAGMLENINFERTEKIGDTLVCHVVADGSNKALEAHSYWHLAVMAGSLMPDCGLYYLEQQTVFSQEQEKAVTSRPSDYALCAVTLEGHNEA